MIRKPDFLHCKGPSSFYAVESSLIYWLINLFQKFKASTFLYSHTGEVHGEVIIEQKSYNPSHINVSVRGLPPGCYGIHIHQYGDQTNGCISAGSHYSPYEFLPHANPLEDGYNFNLTRHAGDLGNIDVGEDGSGTATLIDNMVVLYGKMSVAGRLFTIKNKEDKFGIQKDDVIAYFGTIGYDVPSYHIYRVKNKFAGIMTVSFIESNTTNFNKWSFRLRLPIVLLLF